MELLERLGHQVWVGDAAQIRASYVRKQKTDRRDAAHILKLLMERSYRGAPGRVRLTRFRPFVFRLRNYEIWSNCSSRRGLCVLLILDIIQARHPTHSAHETVAAPPQSASSVSPEIAKAKPYSDWEIQEPTVNPMDNATSQFLSTGYTVTLVLCFQNGKPCGHGSLPVYLKTPCSWIDSNESTSSRRRIRIKFDDGKASTVNWGISDDHKAIFPPNPQAFTAELKKHKTFMVELGCDRSDPGEVVDIGVEGLQLALDSAKLKLN
ncbi:MAG TPA: hypothetical protein VGL89_15905 [Candidatus Koribacter sp.]